MNRRQFLKLSAATAAGLIAPVTLTQSGLRRASAQAVPPTSPLLTKFIDPLPIPGVLPPAGVLNGETYYQVTMDQVQQKVHSEMPGKTTFWGYAGSFPGPTIEARRNEHITVDWINNLPGKYNNQHYLGVDMFLHGPDHGGGGARTVVHLHGGNVPAAVDGFPEDTRLPGEMARYAGYPNKQDANTLWYHDHGLGITRLNVYMGLAGFWLLREKAEDDLLLPSGMYEIPIVIQDRTFTPKGDLWYPWPWQEEYFADTIVVNGVAWPMLAVEPRKYRFRFLNGSNGRAYWMYLQNDTVEKANGKTNGTPNVLPIVYQIGNDGGLLKKRLDLDMSGPNGNTVADLGTGILMSPAERADVIIDFSNLEPGTLITLKNKADAPLFLNSGIIDQPDIMQFKVKKAKGPDNSKAPVDLRSITALDGNAAVRTRDFVLDVDDYTPTGIRLAIKTLDEDWVNDDPAKWRDHITGYLWDDIVGGPNKPRVAGDGELPVPASDPQGPAVLGTIEVWRFWNITPDMHPMHLHLVNFQLLKREGYLPVDLTHPQGEPFKTLVLPGDPSLVEQHYDQNEKNAWHDTVKMYSGHVTSIIMEWKDFPGDFPFHCHILDHEDHEMMRQVRVVEAAS